MDKASTTGVFSGPQLKTLGKPEALREKIRGMAQKAGAGARLPGVAEFCRELQISPNTLGKALTDLEAEGIVERRNGVGVFVSAKIVTSQPTIALICRLSFMRTPGHSPIWDVLVEMLGERTKTTGFEFDCSFSRDPEEGKSGPEQLLSSSLRVAIESGKIGGVLGIGLPEQAAKWIAANDIPVVNLYGYGHTVVKTDREQQIQLCIESLVEHGCTRLGAWFGAPADGAALTLSAEQLQQIEEYAAAVERTGLTVRDDLIENNATFYGAALSFAEQGYQTAKRVFSRPRDEWPDGLLVLDDNMAHGALVALRQMGVHPGRDVKFAAGANAGSPLKLDADELILAEVSVPEIVDAMFDSLNRLLQEIPAEQEVITIPARLRETVS